MKSEPSDDSLLKVIPVYHSKPEDGALYLLQHPTQVESTWNMDGFITSAKLRPSCHQLELEQMIENNQVYNSSMGQQLALNVDGVHRNHRDDSDNSFPSGLMDKSVLRSEGSVEDIDRYCVGELIPGLGLVLAPLSAMLPLRSALDYLDQADSRVKKEKKAEEEAEEGTRSEDATRAVTVRFERPENDRMRNARERSFLHHQRKIMEEPWVKLQYSGFGDSYGEHMRQLT
ncbi:DNA-directed RNA polymerase III subunit RPC5, partial [Hyalella azteca]|uniref:DNA-directed RNA polymerase III subunit RPC5 n=1 Tax=Hyalella azteca TaxID=294128 RepID=A0A8B7MZ36_HYAAZ